MGKPRVCAVWASQVKGLCGVGKPSEGFVRCALRLPGGGGKYAGRESPVSRAKLRRAKRRGMLLCIVVALWREGV